MKKKRKILLTVSLIVLNVLLWGMISYKVINYFLSLGEEEKIVTVDDNMVYEKISKNKTTINRTKINYEKLERDPFRVYVKPVTQKPKKVIKKTPPTAKTEFHFQLNGIIENNSNRLAIIQDTKTGETIFLRKGEMKNGLKIKNITNTEVEVVFENESKVLRVNK